MPKTKIKKKNDLDKFYTRPEVAKECLSLLFSTINIEDYSVIEPSAGSGAFSNQINGCHAYDILPEGSNITEQDFLSLDFNDFHKNVCVVGNPPFGERNSLTKSFIKHACSFDRTKIIAFILPACYKKLTMQKVFTSDWSLIKQVDLPEDSFTLQNEAYHVPCVFQIWEKHSEQVNLREVEHPNYCDDFYILTQKDADKADIFSFGAAPYNLIDPPEVKSNNRGYFLKSCIDKEKLCSNIKSVDWKSKGASSVSGGVFWITKSEFIKYYTERYPNE